MKTLMMGSALALMLTAAHAAGVDWDADASGEIDRSEFDAGMQTDASFTALDADADGVLSEEEFNAGVSDGAFAEWDADASGDLSEEELAEGLFTSTDADASGSLSMDEAAALDATIGAAAKQ